MSSSLVCSWQGPYLLKSQALFVKRAFFIFVLSKTHFYVIRPHLAMGAWLFGKVWFFVPNFPGMLLFDDLKIFDPTCPFQVQWLCGTSWWVPWNFGWCPRFPECFPLIRNVSMFVNPCQPYVFPCHPSGPHQMSLLLNLHGTVVLDPGNAGVVMDWLIARRNNGLLYVLCTHAPKPWAKPGRPWGGLWHWHVKPDFS